MAKMIGTVDLKAYWLDHTHCWTMLLCEQSAGKSMIQANLFQFFIDFLKKGSRLVKTDFPRFYVSSYQKLLYFPLQVNKVYVW